MRWTIVQGWFPNILEGRVVFPSVRTPLNTLLMQGQRTFGNEASKGRKQEVIQNDVAALEMALDSAKAEFQKIATRNREVS